MGTEVAERANELALCIAHNLGNENYELESCNSGINPTLSPLERGQTIGEEVGGKKNTM